MQELNFFDKKSFIPLSERLRPKLFDEIEGQNHIVEEKSWLRKAIELRRLPSLILWGPPGTGKTTLAKVISNSLDAQFEELIGSINSVADIKEIAKKSEELLRLKGKRTILFIDEIHRLNKGQQSVLLRYVEDSTFTLIGTTTLNPGFNIISPLLSRCKVVELKPLDLNSLGKILDRALTDKERGLGNFEISIDEEAKRLLLTYSDGDARKLLNTLELAFLYVKGEGKGEITVEVLKKIILEPNYSVYLDKEETHFDLISAFIKSIRGSDPDAALYWLARMIEAGEDPLFILRRLLILASEDIGNADPQALSLVVAATIAFEHVGMPEGILNIVQAVIYCAVAPKSNAVLTSWHNAKEAVKKYGNIGVPPHLKNAPIGFLKELGYGKDYLYPHNFGGFVEQNYFPVGIPKDTIYYIPTENGFEKVIKERLMNLWKWKDYNRNKK